MNSQFQPVLKKFERTYWEPNFQRIRGAYGAPAQTYLRTVANRGRRLTLERRCSMQEHLHPQKGLWPMVEPTLEQSS